MLHDPASVVSQTADEEAARLWDLVKDAHDLEAVIVLGVFYQARYQRTGGASDRLDAIYFLFSAYKMGERILPGELRQYFAAQRTATRDELATWSKRADSFASRFAKSGELAESDQAIALYRKVAAATANGYPTHANDLGRLCMVLSDRFNQDGNVDGLREAVAVGREAAKPQSSRFDQGHAQNLAFFAVAAVKLCEVEQDDALLDEAVAAARKAVDLIGQGHPSRHIASLALATGLQQLYQARGGSAILSEGIAAARDAVQNAPQAEPHYSHALTLLFTLLLDRYRDTEDEAALEEVVAAGRNVLAVIPLSNQNRAAWVTIVLQVERARYEAAGPARLAQLVDMDRRELMAPGGMPVVALGLVLSARTARDVGAVAEAVALAERALREVPWADPGRGAYAVEMSRVLGIGYEITGDPALLSRALELCREAARPHGDADSRAGYLIALATLLRLRYVRSGEPEDLKAAVRACREAVEITASPDALASLGVSLRAWYERTGDLSVLREAVEVGRLAVGSAGRRASDCGPHQTALGNALMHLYHAAGEREALEECVAAHRAALLAYPEGAHERDKALSNLTLALYGMYQRTGDAACWREARDLAEQSVADTPAGSPDYPIHLSNFVNVLDEAPEGEEKTHDLRALVDLCRQAVGATPDGNEYRGRYLSRLGARLVRLYEETADPEILAEALDTTKQAVDMTVEDRPERANYLMNFALALRVNFEATGDQEAFDEAIRTYESVTDRSAMPVSMRLRAARQAAELAALTGHLEQALDLYGQALDLLPLLAPRALRRGDQYHRLGQELALGSDAAAVALDLGRPERAVEFLEQARGITFGETIDMRSDFAELGAADASLASAFERLRERLSAPVELDSQTRRQLAGEWDTLVQAVRSLDGFEGFLLPLPFSELNAEARRGPIVLLNASRHRCDAIVLSGRDPLVLRLGVTQATMLETVLRLADARLRATDPAVLPDVRRDALTEMRTVLGWLWDTITQPVLDGLGLGVSRQPPRLWWCPTGLLAFLPLHAAGHAGVGRTVLDRVVSSYTPTIRALRHARQQAAAEVGGGPLVVAMPKTPLATDLPAVTREVEAIRKLAGNITLLKGERATSEHVRAEISQHAVAHFACHGLSDLNDPERSRLLLHDHTSVPFTVAAISRMRLSGNRLAYLSACSTGDQVPWLTDEAVHITGAFQLAGYPHVIGTLWPVDDQTSADLCTAVYRQLAGPSGLCPGRAPHALHDAVRDLRADYPDEPVHWAGYVHVGA